MEAHGREASLAILIKIPSPRAGFLCLTKSPTFIYNLYSMGSDPINNSVGVYIASDFTSVGKAYNNSQWRGILFVDQFGDDEISKPGCSIVHT